MFRGACRVPAIALLMAAFGPARAEPVPAEPASAQPAPDRWISNWGDGVCKIVRARGNSPSVMIEVVAGSQAAEMWLVNPDFGGQDDEAMDVSISVLPGGSAHEVRLQRFDYRGDRHYVTDRIPTESLRADSATSTIRLERSGERLLEIPLGNMPAALRALHVCIDDQLRQWGFDPAMYDNLQRPPRGNIASFVTNENYPIRALLERHEGRSIVRISVGVDGRARSCATIVSSGHRELDARTCDVSERLAFEPALDAAGQPVEALQIYSIIWRIH